MKKEVYILRAIPGAGKSTLADSLGGVICCADDYFMDQNGNYNFIQEKIGNAHGYCKYRFKEALANNAERIIVSNTNTEARDVAYYRGLALEAGYIVYVLTVENWHNGKDIHNVPDDVKEKMKIKLTNSIKL